MTNITAKDVNTVAFYQAKLAEFGIKTPALIYYDLEDEDFQAAMRDYRRWTKILSSTEKKEELRQALLANGFSVRKA